jgi:hypothetical protein
MPRPFFGAMAAQAKIAKNAFITGCASSNLKVAPGAFEMLIIAHMSE